MRLERSLAMKQIQQYCSAMDKIKHDPACKQEVLNMAQRNQIHMTKRSGKIAGTAIAAALLAANICCCTAEIRRSIRLWLQKSNRKLILLPQRKQLHFPAMSAGCRSIMPG